MRMVGTLALSPRCQAGNIAGHGNDRQGNGSLGQRFAAIPLTIIPLTIRLSSWDSLRQIQPHEFLCDGERFSFSFGGEGRDEGERETFFNAKPPRRQGAGKTGKALFATLPLEDFRDAVRVYPHRF